MCIQELLQFKAFRSLMVYPKTAMSPMSPSFDARLVYATNDSNDNLSEHVTAKRKCKMARWIGVMCTYRPWNEDSSKHDRTYWYCSTVLSTVARNQSRKGSKKQRVVEHVNYEEKASMYA